MEEAFYTLELESNITGSVPFFLHLHLFFLSSLHSTFFDILLNMKESNITGSTPVFIFLIFPAALYLTIWAFFATPYWQEFYGVMYLTRGFKGILFKILVWISNKRIIEIWSIFIKYLVKVVTLLTISTHLKKILKINKLNF